MRTPFASPLGLMRSLVIYYGRPWRNRALAHFYAGFVSPGDLAIDVGAHVGHRSRALARAGARVVAMEPQAPFATFLRLTLPHGVTLVEAAAGAKDAVADMAVSTLHPTVSSLKPGFAAAAGALPGFGRVRWAAHQRVSVTTLDAVIARYGFPAFLKIDVEGYEAEVLAGLSTPVPVIAFECLPGLPAVTAACLDRLKALGTYQFNLVVGEATEFLWSDWQGRAALDDWLARLAPGDPSGDIYARAAT